MTAKLRACASCEWIYKVENGDIGCPKCGFPSYSAHYVYGKKAYKYAKTQKPWKDRKMDKYEMKLNEEIRKTNPLIQKLERLASFKKALKSFKEGK